MVLSSIKTPGVYINEVSIFPPSVAQVPTAIPAFIGYTEKAEETNKESLTLKYKKISSMVDFVLYYGGAPKLLFDKATGFGVELDGNNQVVKAVNKQQYFLYDSLQMFFANGGGECYIISVDKYRADGKVALGASAPVPSGMLGGLEVLKEVDEPTMIVFPDAVSMDSTELYTVQQEALKQCDLLMDRVAILDIKKAETKAEHETKYTEFRDNIGMSYLKYGAAYTPWLKVGLRKEVRYRDIKDHIVQAGTTTAVVLSSLVKNLSVADTTAINNQITKLNEVVADNKFIAASIGKILSSTNVDFAKYSPDGNTKDLPSLAQGFAMLVNSANSLVAAAEVSPTAASVDKAADEIIKMIRQVYLLLVLIDDFGFKDASFMSNQSMLENTWKTIGYASPFPAFPAVAPADFLAMMTELTQWDGTTSTVNAGNVVITSTPDAAAMTGFPLSTLSFQTFNLPAAASSPAIVTAASGVAAPANDADRIKNQKIMIQKLKGYFDYFYSKVSSIELFGDALEKTVEEELKRMWPVFKGIIDGVNNNLTILPPSGAIAGIYARVDNERGVWKAPANASVSLAKGLLVNITDKMQEPLNIDVNAGKSINAIRSFSGKGIIVWGARTLAGNDNEWRYVSVRRFFNMVEESVKKSTFWAVFEPNDANTWVKVKSMIENYLTLLWRQGALAGAKPDEAFFVEVGLNKTMTFVDILEGRMIVKIGMAAVRPAEFIILEFSHKVQTS